MAVLPLRLRQREDVEPIMDPADIESLIDTVISWWDDDDMDWMGTEDDIKASIEEDFPGHRARVRIDGNSITYEVTGPRVNIDLTNTITESMIT
jgi:hypothetical protein